MTILTLFMAAATAVKAADAPKAKAGDIDGAKLFAAKCATCHAKDAKGNPAMAKMFKADLDKLNLQGGDATKRTDAELSKVVNEGRNKMPSFKGKLKDPEIAAALAYVRSLSPKPAAAAKPAKAEEKPEEPKKP